MKNKKFLLVLPLLVLPFIIALFMILGGGSGTDNSDKPARASGMNVRLPDAHFKKTKEPSKFSLYEEAGKDSVLLKEKMKNDPYYRLSETMTMDSNEARIMSQLEKIKTVVSGKREIQDLNLHAPPKLILNDPKYSDAGFNPSSKRDPQIEQLNRMLDKVMAIQHPELLRDSMTRLAKQNLPEAFSVQNEEPDLSTSTLTNITETHNRFYDLAADITVETIPDNALEAEVSETQTLVSGATIRLRVLSDLRINGQWIGRNQLIYGTVSLSGERLKVEVNSIRSGNMLLPVSLEGFDLDGLAGLYIPGSINRDVAKQGSDQALGSIGLNSLDPSLGAQAAGAGIQVAKTLISKKIKLIKVTVKAGYKLFLKDSRAH